MKHTTSKRDRAATARLRSVLRQVARHAERLSAQLNLAAQKLPEFSAFSGPTSERAAWVLRVRGGLAAAGNAAQEALGVSDAATPLRRNPATAKKKNPHRPAKRTPKRRNPTTKTESSSRTFVDGELKGTSTATRTTTTSPKKGTKPRRSVPKAASMARSAKHRKAGAK